MPETLPECPFCGNDGLLHAEPRAKRTVFRVACKHCGQSTEWYYTREQSIAAWTRRHYRLADGSVYVIDPMGAGLVNCYVMPKKEKGDA